MKMNNLPALLLFFTWISLETQGQNIHQENAKKSFREFYKPNRGIAEMKVSEETSQVKAFLSDNKNLSHDAKMQYAAQRLNIQSPYPSHNTVADSYLVALASTGADTEFYQVLFWNSVALGATSLDHTPNADKDSTVDVSGEQFGPPRTSRAMAIVHLAIFEAVNAVYKSYGSYRRIQSKIFEISGLSQNIAASKVSVRYAIAYAAYNTLIILYPKQRDDLKKALNRSLTTVRDSKEQITNGQSIGIAAAKSIIQLRKFDNSEFPDPPASIYQTNDSTRWMPDPLNLTNPNYALGGNWKYVKPFVLESAEQFRPSKDSIPKVNSKKFNKAFLDVYQLGGDSLADQHSRERNRESTKTIRTPDQTKIGIFWAYDGTPSLCAPPRLYNQIATSLVAEELKDFFVGSDIADKLAYYLALINVGMADAAIASWEAKYYYLYPRPITYIRASDETNSPLKKTDPVQFWTPLGAQVTNTSKRNLTPPFPAFPSGHATFGGALFQIIRKFAPSDKTSFSLVSDEFNEINTDPITGLPRGPLKMTYSSFTEAERDNALSRIYLGIHWHFDATEGIKQGNLVGEYVFKNFPKP